MIKDTRLLLEFAAVAQAGSFTQAARQLGVAQPWLSTQVRKLEEQLGVRLLDRSSRRVELTLWGRELLEIAAPLSAQTRDALAKVAALTNRASAMVRVGMPPSGINEVVAQIMREANLGTTNSDVFVERGISESLLDRLHQGILDLAFIIGSFDFAKDNLDTLYICPVFVDLIVNARDPLAMKDLLRPGDLHGRTISAFPRSLNPPLYDTLFGSLAAEDVKIGHFPELEIIAENNPMQWPESLIRIALSSNIAEPYAPPGTIRIRLLQEQICWLQLVRLKGNSQGRVRRSIWTTAQRFASRVASPMTEGAT
jgi:DNA-binding transcriptional LysR family regulator